MSRRNNPLIQERIDLVNEAKLKAEVVTLREWYDSIGNHSEEVSEYMRDFKQLGRLGKELHNRGVPRVTERFGDEIGTLVEATYSKGTLDFSAPLCALICTMNKRR